MRRSPPFANERPFLAVRDEAGGDTETNYFAAAEAGPRLMKMAFCERPTRTGFQIFLEGLCLVFLLESKVGDGFPWSEPGGVRRIAAVVVEKAFFEISRGPDIVLSRMRFGSEEIDVVYVIWLACSRSLGRCGGPPSPRLRRTLQPSPGASLQAKAGAGDEARTRDVLLGKEVLYH